MAADPIRSQPAADDKLTLEQIQQATAEKESRSAGAGGLADMIQQLGGEKIRFFLLRTHYRSTVLFSDEALGESAAALDSFYRFFERYQRMTGDSFYDIQVAASRAEGEIDAGNDPLLKTVAKCRTAFLEKMDDDFNTGAAISELFELLRSLNKYRRQASTGAIRFQVRGQTSCCQASCPHTPRTVAGAGSVSPARGEPGRMMTKCS